MHIHQGGENIDEIQRRALWSHERAMGGVNHDGTLIVGSLRGIAVHAFRWRPRRLVIVREKHRARFE